MMKRHSLPAPNAGTPAAGLARAWDAEYSRGRYHADPPLKFTTRIIDVLKRNPGLMDGLGLYVGCGNGRNYIPLVETGLNVAGLDISKVALDQLAKKLPQYYAMLHCCDFLDYHPKRRFQYIVSIQSFQHGNAARTGMYFAKASELLERGGLLFLRVNASNTTVYHGHEVIENDCTGSFTVNYDKGPKKGLDVRFFSKKDLLGLVRRNGMSAVGNARNLVTQRQMTGTGSWSQWEMTARKD